MARCLYVESVRREPGHRSLNGNRLPDDWRSISRSLYGTDGNRGARGNRVYRQREGRARLTGGIGDHQGNHGGACRQGNAAKNPARGI